MAFAAAAAVVAAFVGNAVVLCVLSVATRVSAQLSREGDTAAEEEEDVEAVEDDIDDWMDGQAVFERGRDKVKQGEHGEDADKEGEIYDGVGAADSDHVAGDSHDEQGPEELEASHSEVDN